jgi:phosphoribosylaminoimidazole-succinocarboxamide synthase
VSDQRLGDLNPPLLRADARGLRVFHRGKVRDSFDLGNRLLIVASDRVSAFDVVMAQGIPDKGAILTQMSLWWFKQLKDICPNHLDGASVWPSEAPAEWDHRSMLVRKAKRIDIECIVRGHLAGSGWAEYRKSGTLAGRPLPEGLRESDRLPEPMFTPSTKSDDGHDVNITVVQMAEKVGITLTEVLRKVSIDLYNAAAQVALERGVILADTKLEFGFINDDLHLIDECFTPDSSRYWDAQTYEPGRSQPSMDKQFLRDYLETLGWNKEPPPPALPEHIVLGIRDRYVNAYNRITGREMV